MIRLNRKQTLRCYQPKQNIKTILFIFTVKNAMQYGEKCSVKNKSLLPKIFSVCH